jgi:hypothetical protein
MNTLGRDPYTVDTVKIFDSLITIDNPAEWAIFAII